MEDDNVVALVDLIMDTLTDQEALAIYLALLQGTDVRVARGYDKVKLNLFEPPDYTRMHPLIQNAMYAVIERRMHKQQG